MLINLSFPHRKRQVLAVLLLGTGIAEALVDPCDKILDYMDYYGFMCYNASIGQAIWCSIIVGSVFDLTKKKCFVFFWLFIL